MTVAVALAEVVVRILDNTRNLSGEMAPGLVRYDALLGWRLSPGWQGTHRHQDYTVTYRVNALGFRGDLPSGRERLVMLGDSYTFGLGIGAGEGFADQLDTTCNADVLNLAVPGYSPEQVALSLPVAKAFAQGGAILWVIYLGNDLLDIGLPRATQADYLKPYVTSDQAGQGMLANQPVPSGTEGTQQSSLLLEILGATDSRWWQVSRLLSRILVFDVTEHNRAQMVLQWQRKKQLLIHLLDLADMNGVTIALLPGPSYYRSPGSLPAVYQQMILPELEDVFRGRGHRVIDPGRAALLGEDFYPLDGHLTKSGHSKIASALQAQLCQSA